MQLGADRIIDMARHASRQQLAVEFGATELVADRGEESVARVKVIAGGIGADRVLARVGTEQSTTRTLNSTRPGGGIGITGVPHGAQIDGTAAPAPALRARRRWVRHRPRAGE
ncbi:zinc-binding dehydrogenase [[Kitasatospora] papulosa]|uniref:zinc-binding dehydrogenase n=1 Tax=[Kitasatospora] papulosa TaxID=1464011 RepID=UPI003800D803